MTRNFFVALNMAPAELRDGLELVSRTVPLDFQDASLPEIRFTRQPGGVLLKGVGRRIEVGYTERNDAFRGLGLLNARRDAYATLDIRETRKFDKTFVMLDVSRNGVLNGAAMKEWLAFMALAGLNGFMLYTEDTFKIPGEPLFGYLRGAYSQEELRDFDRLADSLGIEMIPCIQTLAHLQRILQYGAYACIKDTSSVLLCEEEATYEFIAKMVRTASAPYKSRRIHICMDEAWDLGRGVYLTRHGFVPPFEIIARHFDRVLRITRELSLRPMMWSDMFFRALSKTHGYYDTSIDVTQAVRDAVPKDVDLVYWDYYHFKESDYDAMIAKHVEMGQTPIVAPGVQTWDRFWSAYDYTEQTLAPCVASALKNGVKELVITAWGDDGTECDYFSCLPLLQYAADMSFTGNPSLDYTKANLKGTLGVDYDDWKAGQAIDKPDFLEGVASTASKVFLWEDPLYGLWQPQLDGHRLGSHYAAVAADLRARIKKGKANARLRHPCLLAEVLALKADLPTLLLEAYRRGDRAAMRKLLEATVPAAVKAVKAMNANHRELWHRNHKPFGWEILERRYGGLLGVFENLRRRLQDYLDGKLERLEELEEPRTKIADSPATHLPGCGALRLQSNGHIYH
ncbi:MAG: beta-N-acetylhexosaminidase [Kiritimatiellae bacterium]|nr:beta-N-acetylhexosaminidase [Kiritimatiellia bacterium]